MATRPAKAPGTPRPGRPQAPGQPAPAKAPASAKAAAPPVAQKPRALRLAAAALAVEAVGMCVAAGFSAVSTADGQSYQRARGAALTLLAVGTAGGFALFPAGGARARPGTGAPGGLGPPGAG